MSKPKRVVGWIMLFLGLVGALAGVLYLPLAQAFMANPAFNGLILVVLVIGIAFNVRQVFALQREVNWLEQFRRSDPERPLIVKPRLLASMARMMSSRERTPLSLNTSSLRSLLDGVQLRLEESRDLSRYLIGLLVFLGLLGTFYGLLITIGSVSDIIGGLSVSGDTVAMFDQLKENLRRPLSGMGTAFSTSLFGLAGSLILGFVDLQTGHAQNRFYNELEDWLSGMTRLGGGAAIGDGDTNVPAYVQALLEQTADGLERMQRAMYESERERRSMGDQLQALTEELGRLAEHLGRESRDRDRAADTQQELRQALQKLGSGPADIDRLSESLRTEIRLLSRTLAAALSQKSS